jgi:hypothetical protein
MLPIDKLKAVKTIIVHENCADGMASAMFLHDALPEAKIIFLQYGPDSYRNLKPSHNMLFCDITPHPETYQQFVEADALVLDHHKGAQKIVEAFGKNGVFGDEVLEPGVCGTTLAFREVWSVLRDPNPDPSMEMKLASNIAHLSGVRDTWQTQDLQWAEACVLAEALRFYPAETWLIGRPFSPLKLDWWDARLATGRILIERNNRAVKKAVGGAHRFTTSRGTKVVLFSGVKLSSDAAELVDKDADLVVGFDYVGIENGEAVLVFSTRSHTSFNCMNFCKANGGGGHTKAAGFSVKFDPNDGAQDPYSVFHLKVEQFEASVSPG